MHNENYNQQKIRLVSLVSFLLGFLDAFLIYILSGYFAQITGSENVGMFYLVANGLVLVSLFFLQALVRTIGQSRMLYLSLGLTILLAAVLIRLPESFVGLGLVVLFMSVTSLTWVTLDILLESFSVDRYSGRIRGLYLTIMNAGLLLAPFLSTLTLERYAYSGVFFVLLLGYIVIFIIALVGFRSDNKVAPAKLAVRSTWKKLFRERNLLHIYHVSFSLDFFYALMIVYMPLHLRNLGFAWTEIGLIFTAMLLPFIFLQYPLGRLADRNYGERELLAGCILIGLGATAVIPFIDSASLALWALILFLTRVGASGIEVLRDSYFYKQIDAGDLDIIAFFRTSRPLANVIAAGIAFIFLLFLPLAGIFFFIVGSLALSLLSALRLKDTKSEQELGAPLATPELSK